MRRFLHVGSRRVPESADGSSEWLLVVLVVLLMASVVVLPVAAWARGVLVAQILTLVGVWAFLGGRSRATPAATLMSLDELVTDVLPVSYVRCGRQGLSVVVAAIAIDERTTDDREQVARRLAASLRRTDSVALSSGSTLVLALEVKSAANLAKLGSSLHAKCSAAGMVTFRVGVATYPDEPVPPNELVGRALRRLEPNGDGGSRGRLGQGVDSVLSLPRNGARLFDLFVASFLLVATFPVIVIAALAIRLETPGRAVYEQVRTGRFGQPFRLYKLRTMVEDADQRLDEVMHLNVLEGHFKAPNDPRVTKVGRLLRKLSIDELPQLWNVLRGDMAIVGPRPTTLHLDEHDRWQLERLAVRPGLTGLWQVTARGASTFDDRSRLDIEYARERSLAVDAGLICRTVPAVLSGRGAH